MEKIIQIATMHTDLVKEDAVTEIRGILWGLGSGGTLYKLGENDKWEQVAVSGY